MQVLDQYGERWRVQGGDPALRLVNGLEKQGFGLVVLPRAVLLTGNVKRGTLVEDLSALPATEFVRAVRLNECLTALKGVSPVSSDD